jgi:hypothetical protein
MGLYTSLQSRAELYSQTLADAFGQMRMDPPDRVDCKAVNSEQPLAPTADAFYRLQSSLVPYHQASL